MVGSGSELSGLKAIEALPKLKPGSADRQLHHPLDEYTTFSHSNNSNIE
jgi:hypothetical protein